MAGTKMRSLPATADSRASMDPELEQLMREFPGYTQVYLNNILSSKEQVAKAKQKRQTKLFPKEFDRVPQSDYKATFIPKDIRPRSSKQPIRLDPLPQKVDAANYETAYKSEYKTLDLSDRAVTYKKTAAASNFPTDGEAVTGVSAYKENFVPLDLAKAHQDPNHRPRTQTKVAVQKFEGTTTNKLHYTQPQSAAIQLTFGELPSFAGSIIFPSGNFEGESTSMAAYQPYVGARRVEANKSSPFKANLKPEGEMDTTTVHRSTYKPLPLDERLPKAAPPRGEIHLKSNDGGNSYCTQSMEDFQYRRSEPVHPVNPLRGNINLRFDKSSNYETEQRSQYRGFDTSIHLPPKSFKKENVSDMMSSDKFDGSTCNSTTYVPHNLAVAYNAPAPPKAGATGLISGSPKFFSETTSKQHFRDWSDHLSRDHYRHGDFTEALRALLQAAEAEAPAKFATETTSSSAYVPLPLDRVHKVEPSKGSIKMEGERDFQTEYKKTFVQPKVRLSRDDLSKLKGLLVDLKTSRGTSQNQPAN